ASDADAGTRFEVYVRDTDATRGLPAGDRLTVRRLGPALPGYAWQSLVMAPRAWRCDVLFAPSYRLPAAYRGRSVLAIHSVNEVTAGTHPRRYRYTHGLINRHSARRADAVIVPSQSVLLDIQRAYGLPAEKLAVVPQGADEAFRPIDDAEVLRAARRRLVGDDRPYLLWVGKLSQRRNIPALLEAFALLKRRHAVPHALVLMGPNHLHVPLERLSRDLGIEGSVVQTDGRIAHHSELVPVYNAADAYVNASAYEGFSMTLVEALSCGLPCVVANRGALPEIAGDAAVYVDDPRPEPLAEAMHRVLDDAELRGRLRAAALRRAVDLRWDVTARRTLDVLRRVAGSGSAPQPRAASTSR
ncbi:MAG TPA: glycosyltransferase family 1 protein, partial [Candidatus Dormibacteraeota bacterium]|nr:glycosyltransferase family 1 protein [Candidatus Dormibacteraeota bacterium]